MSGLSNYPLYQIIMFSGRGYRFGVRHFGVASAHRQTQTAKDTKNVTEHLPCVRTPSTPITHQYNSVSFSISTHPKERSCLHLCKKISNSLRGAVFQKAPLNTRHSHRELLHSKFQKFRNSSSSSRINHAARTGRCGRCAASVGFVCDSLQYATTTTTTPSVSTTKSHLVMAKVTSRSDARATGPRY